MGCSCTSSRASRQPQHELVGRNKEKPSHIPPVHPPQTQPPSPSIVFPLFSGRRSLTAVCPVIHVCRVLGMATPLDILTLLGKYGYGTVAQTELDPDLLCYLQMCPSWNSLGLAMEHLQQRTKVSGCLTAEEAALCLKTEIPGIVDEENPPKCRSLNSDKDLQPILWALGRFRASRWLGRRRALHPGIAALSPGAISLAPIIPAVGAAASAITSGP